MRGTMWRALVACLALYSRIWIPQPPLEEYRSGGAESEEAPAGRMKSGSPVPGHPETWDPRRALSAEEREIWAELGWRERGQR